MTSSLTANVQAGAPDSAARGRGAGPVASRSCRSARECAVEHLERARGHGSMARSGRREQGGDGRLGEPRRQLGDRIGAARVEAAPRARHLDDQTSPGAASTWRSLRRPREGRGHRARRRPLVALLAAALALVDLARARERSKIVAHVRRTSTTRCRGRSRARAARARASSRAVQKNLGVASFFILRGAPRADRDDRALSRGRRACQTLERLAESHGRAPCRK